MTRARVPAGWTGGSIRLAASSRAVDKGMHPALVMRLGWWSSWFVWNQVLQSIWLRPSTSTDPACRRGVTHRSSRLPSLTWRCHSPATVDGGLSRTSVRRQTVIDRARAEAPQCDLPFLPVSLLLPSATAAQCWLARLPPLPARCGLSAVKKLFLAEVQEAGLPASYGAGLKERVSETTPPTAAAQFPPQDLVPRMLLPLFKNKIRV